MIDNEFDHIVSLGSFCQTAYQIRKNFPSEKASIFDWWVTPTFGLVELLEEDFGNLFQPDNMQIVDEDTGKAVMCKHYGIMHYHDFKNEEDRVDGMLKPLLVRAACARNLAKVAHLYRRLSSLSGNVLFIRFAHGHVHHYQRNADFDDALLIRLVKALEQCVPNADFKILLLNGYYKGAADHRVIVDVVDNYDEKLWYGSDRGWAEMFERLQIKLKNNGEPVVAVPDYADIGF